MEKKEKKKKSLSISSFNGYIVHLYCIKKKSCFFCNKECNGKFLMLFSQNTRKLLANLQPSL